MDIQKCGSESLNMEWAQMIAPRVKETSNIDIGTKICKTIYNGISVKNWLRESNISAQKHKNTIKGEKMTGDRDIRDFDK